MSTPPSDEGPRHDSPHDQNAQERNTQEQSAVPHLPPVPLVPPVPPWYQPSGPIASTPDAPAAGQRSADQLPADQLPWGEVAPRPRRFATGPLFGGIATSLFAVPVIAVVFTGLLGQINSNLSALAIPVSGMLLFGPLIAGVILAATHGSPSRRGFGLGLVIGWGVLVIVAGGLCIAIIAAFNSSSGG